MNKVVLAFDLGGTNLRLAAVNAEGKIIFRMKRDTPKSDQVDEILQTIIECANESRKDFR